MNTKTEFNTALKHIGNLLYYREVFLNDPETEKIYDDALKFYETEYQKKLKNIKNRRIAPCTPKP